MSPFPRHISLSFSPICFSSLLFPFLNSLSLSFSVTAIPTNLTTLPTNPSPQDCLVVDLTHHRPAHNAVQLPCFPPFHVVDFPPSNLSIGHFLLWYLWWFFWLLPWFFFGGGCGLSFMGCNWLMLVGYDGGCGLILVVWLILDFSYGGQW